MLGYDYASARAVLSDPQERDVSPHLYVLCSPCAEKLRPPRGWILDDRRSTPPLFLQSSERPPERIHLEPAPEPEVAEAGRQLFFGQSA